VLCEVECVEGKAEETDPKLDRENGVSLMCDKTYEHLDWFLAMCIAGKVLAVTLLATRHVTQEVYMWC